MPRSHPPYPIEFREQMVELVRGGRNPAELSREFRCSAQAIRNWAAQAAVDTGKRSSSGDDLSAADRELTRLRRQMRQLQVASWQRLRPDSPAGA